MKTRGLKIVVNSDGVLKTRKIVRESKETQIQRIYANKIYKILLNTLNSKILKTQEDHPSNTNGSDTDSNTNLNTLKSHLDTDTNTNNNLSSVDFNSEIEKLNSLIDQKFEGNNELYIKHISSIIANRCYREYMDNPRMLKRKLFELYSNIKRENNVELRLKIIFKKITINQLIKSDIVELAPENVKNIRKQQVERHYARNVILSSELDNKISSKDNDNSIRLDVSNTSTVTQDDSTENNNEYNDSETNINPKPDITNYKYEKIHQNILDKLNRLPVFLRKPFLDNMNMANKRLQLLFNRSSILNKV